MFLSSLLVLLWTSMPGQGVPQDARAQFDSAVGALMRKDTGRAITEFLMVPGRYKESPLAPWGLYYAGWLNELRGDYMAARRNYQRAVDEYRHPYEVSIRARVAYLDKGLGSGGPIILRQWDALMKAPPTGEWVGKSESFLKRVPKFYYSGRLRIRLAAWHLLYHRVSQARRQLVEATRSPDTETAAKALKALVPILVNRGDLPGLRRLSRELPLSSMARGDRYRNNIGKMVAGIERVRLINFIVWGCMVLFLVFLIFPRKKKRVHSLLFFLPLALLLWVVPGTGPVLSTMGIHVVLLLWLFGKKRGIGVWIGSFAYLIYTPVLALILTNHFPYTLFLSPL
ncbi:hypothetical protein KKF84_13030 [Myxococcota bacterium]|nr:hypothetical protein [Myxococcota bacterium]MBU1536241.1 hypothetical protein [Myxococcota bacterium]